MRVRALAVATALALAAPSGVGTASRAAAQPLGDPRLFAGGGTNLTNGFFFPGTTLYDSEEKEFNLIGPPLQIEQGQNIEFVNLDPAVLTNVHRIRSVEMKKRKKKKGKRPLFQSKPVAGPGTTTVVTKRLKPGRYVYLCTTHAGMFGTIEVLEKS